VSAEKRLASKSFEKTIEVYWRHQQLKGKLSRRPRKTRADDYKDPAAVFCESRAEDPSSPLHVLPASQGLQDIDCTPALAMTMIGLNPDVRRLKAFGVGGKPGEAKKTAPAGSQPLMDAANRPPGAFRRPKSADRVVSGSQTARESQRKPETMLNNFVDQETAEQPEVPRPHSVCGTAPTMMPPHSARGSSVPAYDARNSTSAGRFLAQTTGLSLTPYQGAHPGDIPEMEMKEGSSPVPSKDLLVRLFSHGVSHEGEGRAGYLKARKWAQPNEKYSRPLTEAQQIGWAISDHQYATMSHSRKSPTKHFFRSTPCSSLHRHEDNPRLL